jgi:hypothetical protein
VQLLIVTGSRDADDWAQTLGALTVLHAQFPQAVLFSGNCPRHKRPGFDFMCEVTWARLCGHASVRVAVDAGCMRLFPADWHGPCTDMCPPKPHRKRRPGDSRDYCPVAGNRRNQHMVDEAVRVATLDEITALAMRKPGAANTGTRDCVLRQRKAGIEPITLIDSTPLAA